MFGEKRFCTVALCVAGLAVLVLSSFAHSSFTPDKELDRAGTRAEAPVVLGSLENTLDVSPGGYYDIELIENGTDYRAQPLTDPRYVLEGLPNGSAEVLSAADRSPDWLREDLLDGLVKLSEAPLNTAWAVSLADFDGDGDQDLLAGGQDRSNYIRYFENRGTGYSPCFVERGINLPPYSTMFADPAPAWGDMDADGDLDIVFGEFDGNLHYFRNDYDTVNGTYRWTFIPFFDWNVADGHTAPFIRDLDMDGDLDIVCGSEGDGVLYLENRGSPQNPFFAAEYTVVFNVQAGDRSKPALGDLDTDGDLDLLVGNADGDISYFENIGTPQNHVWTVDNPTDYSQMQAMPDVQALPADLDGDGLLDVMVLDPDREWLFYKNYGSISNPQFTIWSTFEVVPGYHYYETQVPIGVHRPDMPVYFSRVINQAEQRYVDEIAFCVAFLSTEDLRIIFQNDFGEVLLDNALYLYKNDQYLKYANIVEKGSYSSGDYYSTIEYYYRGDNGDVKRTMPREIYYWYVVHPKISTQEVGYVNPANGQLLAKDQGGRFWREYLFWHADSEYPPDPSGGVKYPKTAPPPLLKDAASGPTVVHDGVTYSPPAGHNNNGTVNNRPFGYRDHGIDAVSNWVSKTLPLNQQEVDDDERPVQPVRIAHHHNGNCGELHDLTVSASRTCLIPATGVGMPGEDHTWSEFWLDGWHQWDNYWSDGGGDIDNFYTYWNFWGGSRTGSGVYKEQPHCGITDVSRQYIPEDKQSTVTVTVRDRDGYPVDGARVTLFSHWLLEFGDDPSVTLPVPNIYNYTDDNGRCVFTCANRDISLKVVSKLGNAAQQKTYIGAGERVDFTFTLEGAKPRQEINIRQDPFFEPEFHPDRPLLVLEYRVDGGMQYPPAGLTGEIHPQDIDAADIDVFLGEAFPYYWYLSGQGPIQAATDYLREASTSGTIMFQMPYGHPNDYHIVFSNQRAVETHAKLWYRLTTYEHAYDYQNLFAGFSNPREGQAVQAGDVVNVTGYYLNMEPSANVTSVQVSVDGGGTFFDAQWEPLTPWGGTFLYTWDTLSYLPKNIGYYDLVVRLLDDKGAELDVKETIRVNDGRNGHLRFRSPAFGATLTLGNELKVTGDVTDNFRVQSVRLFRGTAFQKEITGSLSKTAPGKWSWSFAMDTAGFGEGAQRFLVLAADPYGYEAKEVVVYRFQNGMPGLELLSPSNGTSHQIGQAIPVTGRAYDDTYIDSLTLKITGENGSFLSTEDLTPLLGEDGNFSYDWDTSLRTPGPYTIEVAAGDQFGKTNTTAVEVALVLPPDDQPPLITINKPVQDAVLQPGNLVEIAGLASDDRGLSRVEVRISGPGTSSTQDVTDSISGTNQWRYVWDTADSGSGGYKITAAAWDLEQNYNSTYVIIELKAPEEKKDRTPPVVTITAPSNGEQVPQGTKVEVKGTATDDIGIAMVSVSTDGGLTYQNADMNGQSWSHSWFVPLDEIPGDRVILVTAKDTYGREADASVAVSVVDDSAPTLLLTNEQEMSSGTYRAGDSLTVYITARDNVAVERLQLAHSGYSPEELDFQRGLETAEVEYTLSIPYDAPSGALTVTVTAYDSSGNTVSATTSIDVAEPEKEKDEDDGKDEGGLSTLWIVFIAGLVVLGVVFLVVAFLIVRKR